MYYQCTNVTENRCHMNIPFQSLLQKKLQEILRNLILAPSWWKRMTSGLV